MDYILFFIINRFKFTEKTISIKLLAEAYLSEVMLLDDNCIDYCSKLREIENKIYTIIKKENEKFSKDNLLEPFIIRGSSADLVKKSETFNILQESINVSQENCNEFANRIGSELLKRMGCNDDDIVITPDSNDDGIDYWGKLKFNNVISDKDSYVLIIGQVKKYSGSIPVEDLREFVGAVYTALESGVFGEDINRNTPYLLQFVTTGELSKAGAKVADVNIINIITKRHLSKMGLLNS